MFFRIWRDIDDEWHWSLWISEVRKIAESGRPMYNEVECLHEIAIIKASASAPIYR